MEILSKQLRVTYIQDKDCTGNLNDGNYIEIISENGGGGDYMVIKTERWAMDNTEEFIEILKDFENKLKLLENNE